MPDKALAGCSNFPSNRSLWSRLSQRRLAAKRASIYNQRHRLSRDHRGRDVRPLTIVKRGRRVSICKKAELEKRFSALSSNTTLVLQAVNNLEEWLSDPVYADQREAIQESHVRQGRNSRYCSDSFYQMVPFGTGGPAWPRRLRTQPYQPCDGRHVRAGALRTFLRASGLSEGRIVVAFDTRIFADVAHTYAFLGDANPLQGLTSRALT